jgi:hypothetical protein
MILSLFLPRYIREKLAQKQRILSLSLNGDVFVATLCIVSAVKTIIKEKIALTLDVPETDTDKIQAKALMIKKSISTWGRFDQIIITESSETLIFKELELPFNKKEQIALVLEEEIETHLPFDQSEGYTGFSINSVNPDGSAVIITATLKKMLFQERFGLFAIADIKPTLITVDAQGIAAFIDGMYAQLNPEIQLRIIINTYETYTQIIFSQGSAVHSVKNIQQGKNVILSNAQVDDSSEKKAVSFSSSGYEKWLKKIIFICDALGFKFSQETASQELFFMQSFGEEKSITRIVQSMTDRKIAFMTEAPPSSKLIVDESPTSEPQDNSTYAAIIGNAYLLKTPNYIDLMTEPVEEQQIKIVKNNVFLSLILLLLSATILGFCGYQQIATLQQTLNIAEKTQLSKLSEKFPIQFSELRKPTLKRAISTIEDFVREQQINIFSGKNLNALEILYELTELIDQRVFIVDITQISITLSEEDKTPRASIDGTFKSRTDAHYSDFGIFEKHLNSSKRLMMTKDTENSFADDAHGVKFTARFKLRD